MPQMVLNRNHILTSTLNHSIAFKKGEPIGVPPSLVKQALSIGAEFVEAQKKEEFLPEEPKQTAPVPVGDERETLIYDVFQRLEDRNDPLDFTAGGKPKFKVVTSMAGFRVDAEEVGEKWQSYKEMKAAAKE